MTQSTKPPSAAKQELPRDLDGDFYRNDELGPWKVTACCGAYVKGGEFGVYCRGCYADMDDFHDAPAHLSDPAPPSMPAWLTAQRVALATDEVPDLPGYSPDEVEDRRREDDEPERW